MTIRPTRSTTMLGMCLALLSLAAIPGCWSRSGPLGHDPFEKEDSDPDFVLPQIGNGLEFRIVANEMDDREAIGEAAQFLGNGEIDPALKAELADLQAKGLPPPGPRWAGENGAPREFKPGNQTSRRTYSWVELGPQERAALQLGSRLQGAAWNEMEAARLQGRAVQLTERDDWKLLQGALFYSRQCKNQNLTEEQRQKKQFDCFVLTRNPEIDENGTLVPRGKPRAVTGNYLSKAFAAPDLGGRPVLYFSFNETGGSLLQDLTQNNLPDDGERQVRRHLAMIFHGMIVSAPTINSRISRDGQVSGNFTRREVDNFVAIMRAGMEQRQE